MLSFRLEFIPAVQLSYLHN